jgi:4-hydroxy-2-oxoheptanedioate aldolase
MIETAEAMRHIDAIAAVPGPSALYVGPADLEFAISPSAETRARGPAWQTAVQT